MGWFYVFNGRKLLLATFDPHADPTQMHQQMPEAATLVRENWAAVYGLLYRLSGNVHDAEELSQDTFIKALKNLGQFKPGTSLRSWLLRIATNHFLDIKRKKRPFGRENALEGVAARNTDVDFGLAQSELGKELNAALEKLSPTQRSVFLLRATENISFREISEIIGTTEATARWHMLQARQILLSLMRDKC